MSKNKPNWVHMAVGKFATKLTPTTQAETTLCGKSARRILASFVLDEVSCPRCLEKLKAENWFCEEHGFINDTNVTSEENCAQCGRPVA